jgi:hypothetical protein
MTRNDTNTKGTAMSAEQIQIVEILKALGGEQSARDVGRKCGALSLKEVESLKRKLKGLVKAGILKVKIVKAWHKVDIQGKFGGAAVGAHKEARYSIA